MKRRKEERTRARVTEIAPTGEGVAHLVHQGERRAVFVRGAAEGDELEIDVDFSRRPARGRIALVVHAGESRVPSPCAVADRCGGCDYMHIARDAQLAAHEAHVRAALPKESRDVPIAMVRADAALRYRSRARLHVRSSGGRAVVGFFAPETHQPVETDACIVLAEPLDRVRPLVADLLHGAAGEGEARIALGAFGEDRRPVLDLSWGRELPGAVYARAEQAVLAKTFAGVRIACGETKRPATIGDPTPWIMGPDGEPLELAPSGFAQASEEMNAKLAREAATHVPEGARVLELHSGAGNFTVLLARRAAKLTAVEFDAASCEAARRNLARRDLKATIVAQDASEFAIGSVDAIVLDPPRTGAAKIAQSLAGAPVKRVVYVSCDTRTLSRDLAILAPAYEIAHVAAFEMFPHTSHVETLVVLGKRRRA